MLVLKNYRKWLYIKEMEKRIDSGEIFGKSEKERKVDFATNEIIDKIRAAGIEVVTDKDEFDWTKNHINEISLTLEMLGENPLAVQQGEKKEIRNLSPSQNDMKSRFQSLEQRIILNSSNSQELYTNKTELIKQKIKKIKKQQKP